MYVDISALPGRAACRTLVSDAVGQLHGGKTAPKECAYLLWFGSAAAFCNISQCD